MRRRLIALAGVLLLLAGGGTLARVGYLRAKAEAATLLIDRAFIAHLQDGRVHRPWPWADTHPIAQLEAPQLGARRIVLAGSSGSSLAFGPGHVDGSAAPNERGDCLIAGHRDGSFRFLQRLRPGEELRVRTHGRTLRYVVRELLVLREDEGWRLEGPGDRRRLVLVTCWPFEGMIGGPWRYAVIAEPLRVAARPRRSQPDL